jgi:hypothetical protein
MTADRFLVDSASNLFWVLGRCPDLHRLDEINLTSGTVQDLSQLMLKFCIIYEHWKFTIG